MKKSASVSVGPWLDAYEAPKSLKHAYARLHYALKELVCGSPHRAVDVLLRGWCEFPMFILKDKINIKYKPPVAPFKPYLPKTLKLADLKLRAVIRCIEQGDLQGSITMLRRS